MNTVRSEKISRKRSTNFSVKMVSKEWSIKWPLSKRSSAFTTWRSSLPKSEYAPPPRDRGSRCHDLNSNRCRRNISGRRNPKVSLSRRPRRGPLYQDWHSGAGHDGAIRRSNRNRVWRPPDHRFADAARSDSAPHRYQRGDCVDQDSHFARLRFLGFFSYKTSALRISEHDPRGAHRFGNVVRFGVSTRRRRGQNVLAGCGAHRGGHELGRGEIIPIQLPPSQGVRNAKLRGFPRLRTKPTGHQIFGPAGHDQFLSGRTERRKSE